MPFLHFRTVHVNKFKYSFLKSCSKSFLCACWFYAKKEKRVDDTLFSFKFPLKCKLKKVSFKIVMHEVLFEKARKLLDTECFLQWAKKGLTFWVKNSVHAHRFRTSQKELFYSGVVHFAAFLAQLQLFALNYILLFLKEILDNKLLQHRNKKLKCRWQILFKGLKLVPTDFTLPLIFYWLTTK